MKKFLVAIALSCILFTGCRTKNAPSPLPVEQKASHMILLLDKDGENVGECSATAIGPHAIMTADHCNERDEMPAMNIDLSTRVYNIMGAIHDGRDHVIYFLDGPAFRNTIIVNERDAFPGEFVHLYGNGEHTYPARPLYGRVIDNDDPSDVDQDQGMTTFSLQPIPGDSGSAIYGAEGSVVALVTYGHTTEGLFGRAHHSCKSFSLAFKQSDLDAAQDPDIHFPAKLEDKMLNALFLKAFGID